MHFAEKYVARCANLNSPGASIALKRFLARPLIGGSFPFEILGLVFARSAAIRASIGFRARKSFSEVHPGSLRVASRRSATVSPMSARVLVHARRRDAPIRRDRAASCKRYQPRTANAAQTTRVAARSSADIGVTIDSPASVSKRGVHAREGNALGERRAARQNDCNTISLIGGNEASAQHHVQTLIST